MLSHASVLVWPERASQPTDDALMHRFSGLFPKSRPWMLMPGHIVYRTSYLAEYSGPASDEAMKVPSHRIGCQKVAENGDRSKLRVIQHHQATHSESFRSVVPVENGPGKPMLPVDQDNIELTGSCWQIRFRCLGCNGHAREIDIGLTRVLTNLADLG